MGFGHFPWKARSIKCILNDDHFKIWYLCEDCHNPYSAILDNILIVENYMSGAVKVHQCLLGSQLHLLQIRHQCSQIDPWLVFWKRFSLQSKIQLRSCRYVAKRRGERRRGRERTSSGECVWDLWVPFNILACASWEFARIETIRRSKFLRKRNIAETPLLLKYSTTPL